MSGGDNVLKKLRTHSVPPFAAVSKAFLNFVLSKIFSPPTSSRTLFKLCAMALRKVKRNEAHFNEAREQEWVRSGLGVETKRVAHHFE